MEQDTLEATIPTALELTREEWKPYFVAARRRPTPPVSSPEDQQEREQLLLRVGEAVAVLKERFAVRRAVLFGSLASSTWFTPDSDVDLAVEGLRPSDFWEAWQVVEDIIADRPVDLVELETARPSLIKAIERYGVEL